MHSATHNPSGVEATLPTLVSSSANQPLSTFAGLNNLSHKYLLGRKGAIFNYDISSSSIQKGSDSMDPLKGQRLAMHVNTRHLASYHPNQHGMSLPIQGNTNQSVSQEFQPEHSTGQSKPANTSGIKTEDNDTSSQHSWNNPAIFLDQSNSDAVTHVSGKQVSASKSASGKSKSIFHTRQRKQNKPYTIPPTVTPSIFQSNPGTNPTSSRRDVIPTQPSSKAQKWTKAIKHICDVRKKQLLELELFGDKLNLAASAPELLKQLKDIDQKKNLITYEEEHAAGLIEAITEVLETCDNSTEKEIIMLAHQILDNLLQRFRAVRFRSGSH